MDCVPSWLKPRKLTGLDVYRADPFAGHIARLREDFTDGVLDADDVRLHVDALIDDSVVTTDQGNDMFLMVVGGLPVQFGSDRMPFELFIQGGLIGEITEWMAVNMSRHQPEFALMAALQTVAAAIARRVKSDMGDGTNLYQFLIGPSASGKDWPLKATCDALIASGGAGLVGSGSLTSATAGLVQLADNPAILFPIDEAGKTLGAHQSKRAESYASELMTFLLKAFSSAWSWKFLHKGKADKKDNIEICCPHVSILGVSTPETMYGNAVTMESLSDGLMSRIMMFDTGDHVPPLVQVSRTDPPESVCQQLRKWIEFEPSGDLGWKLSPQPKLIPTSPEALRAFQAANVVWDITADRFPHEGGSAYRRLGEHARKYALILACSEKEPTDEIVIQKRHADWSIALVSWLAARSIQIVKTKVVASQREKDMALVKQFVLGRLSRNERTSMSDVARKFRSWDARYRGELVNGLVECGELSATKVDTSGRDLTVFEVPENSLEPSFPLSSQT